MRKILNALLTSLLVFISFYAKAQITVGTVDAGPYTPGSTIAATFTLGTTCIQQTNIFNLFLVSPAGTETKIGFYTGFYSTFVNGVIPAATAPGNGYKLRIKSTAPALTSNDSAPFNIQAGMPVLAAVTSFPELSSTHEVFGYCPGKANVEFDFTNQSTANSTVTGTVKNELTGANQANLVFSPTPPDPSFVAPLAHFTVFITAKLNGTVGTRAYMVINNSINNSFGTSGGSVVCLPGGFLEYSVDLTDKGIKNNYPGNTYQIKWGDGNGTPEIFTPCDLKTGSVRHRYTQSSCGSPVYNSGNGPQYNVFGINISVFSQFCGNTGAALSTYVKVVNIGENRFTSPAVACTGSAVSFTNTSVPGQTEANVQSCTDNSTRYNWYINGVKTLSNVPVTTAFNHQFTTPGVYHIELESVTTGQCNGVPVFHDICIQNPPKPSFTLPAANLCLSAATLTPTNTSIIDNTCPDVAAPVYTWTVLPAAGVTYTGGTNKNSLKPTFNFSQTGVYTITLTVQSATCQETTAPQEVVVNTVPQATLSAAAKFCTPGGTLTFGPNGGLTKTLISGTAKTLADTYTWTVTGGSNYNFVTPDGPNTQYPTINFTAYGTYTVTLNYKNNCGTLPPVTQTITFSPSPVPLITVNPTACYNTPINLKGEVTDGTYTSFTWSSTGGGVFSDPLSLTPVYTPSAADLAALSTTITLTVNTGIPGSCAVVKDMKTVTIFPNNTGTSTSQFLCSGNTTAYTPVSSIAGSTFTWTAANADGNARPGSFSPSGSGNISETIVNTNATANAVVIYTITPAANGCTGVPFTFTVTVTPKPILTAIPASPAICSNQLSAIALSSNLGVTTRYTWTSTATNGAANTVTGNHNNTVPATATAINDRLINNGTAQGSVTYTITPISATGCPGVPVTVTVLVNPAVTPANAGPDENICALNTYTLNGNQPAVGSGTWTFIPLTGQTGVTITNPTSKNASVSGLTGGQTYTFRWTISAAGACLPSQDDVVIKVNIATVAGTTATAGPVTVCEAANSGTITLAGNIGAVLRWESSVDAGITWTAIPNTTVTLTYTNITVSTRYRAVVQNGNCAIENSTATMITVIPATTPAVAGANQALCAQTTAVLDGNIPKTGETGRWTLVSGSPNTVITDPANPKTTVTKLVAGQNYTFKWTITGQSPCGPATDEMTIVNRPPLTNSISSTSTVVCYGQAISVTGSIPTGGDGTYSYRWESKTETGAWAAIAGKTGKDLNITLLSIGATSFKRIVSSGNCMLESNVVMVTAQPPIGNNSITADQSICTGLAPAPLTGSTPTGSDGHFNFQWQQSENNGATWTAISGAIFANYTPPVLTATTLYRRAVSSITCNGALESMSAPVTITVKPNAKAEFTFTADKACTPFVINANNIKAVPYADRNATYTWYADNVQIGTGIAFPGYTLSNSNESVTIKLVTAPSQGCQPDEFSHVFSTNQSVTASYTQSATEGCGPLVVNFVNTSTSLTNATFRWNFGNGTTSSQVMPAAVTFQPDPTGKDTTYTVTLTAITSCGSNVITSTVFVKAKPVAVFSPSNTTGCSPMTVTFSNTSPGGTNTYYYDFGDGTLLTKTDKSPVQHLFTTNVVKDFVVKMIAENECGRDESTYTIRVSPNTVLPELVVNADEKEGCAPFKVNFYNNSKGANLFKYDFGDGSTALTRSAPEVMTHTFTTPGTYTIVLTASNGCSDTTTTESITVLPQPLAQFNAAITSGCTGLAVQFQNTSTGGVSYLWDFGDGTTSAVPEPLHVYNGDQEFYTVTLTATNTLGCTYTEIKNEYIHIITPPVAQFNVAPSTVINIPDYTFRFEDESTNNPTIWLWDFGDRQTSALQNPSHTYPDTGTYVVTLRVANQQGCFTTASKKVTIIGVPGYLYVPNSFMPGSETPELRVFKAKGSGIKSWRMGIFNKWGQKLWETTQLEEGRPAEGWDGTFGGVPAAQDVYFWKIDVEFINGTEWKGMTYDSSAPKRTGPIHLIK